MKGYVELEARLNSIGSSYEITKLENGNFEVRPTLDIGRHEKLVFIVEQDLIRADSWFRVEVPGSELILSCVRDNTEYKFADVSDLFNDGIPCFYYSSHPRGLTPKVPFVKIFRYEKVPYNSLFLGRQSISITPQNIERFFRLYTNRAAETNVSVQFNRNRATDNKLLNVFFTLWVVAMLILWLHCAIESILSDYSLMWIRYFSCYFNTCAYLPFMLKSALEGRLVRFMHKNPLLKLLALLILEGLSFLFPNFMIFGVLAVIAVVMIPSLTDALDVLLFIFNLIFM